MDEVAHVSVIVTNAAVTAIVDVVAVSILLGNLAGVDVVVLHSVADVRVVAETALDVFGVVAGSANYFATDLSGGAFDRSARIIFIAACF